MEGNYSFVEFQYKAGRDYPVFEHTVLESEAKEINDSDQEGNSVTYVCRRIDDCYDEEINAIAEDIIDKDDSEIGSNFIEGDLTDDDIMFVAEHSSYISGMFFGATYTFNSDPKTAETAEDYFDIMKSVIGHMLKRITKDDFVIEQDEEDFKTDLKRLDFEDAGAIYKNDEMTLVFSEDIIA